MFDVTPKFETEGTHSPDNLLAGDAKRISVDGVLITPESRARGALLGKMTKDTVGAVTPDGGNTGDGAPTAATLGAEAEVGVYTLRCIAAAGDAGTFAVFAPSGARLADLTVAVAYVSDHINLTIADGAADFIVGDEFTIEVSGTGKFKLSAAAAVDGSQDPYGVLIVDVDATEEDKPATVYITGEFNERAVTFGAGHTADSVRDALAARGLFLKGSIAA